MTTLPAAAEDSIQAHLDLWEPLCYQPPHLSLPSGKGQSHEDIIDAIRALFIENSLSPVCQDKAAGPISDDQLVFARAHYPKDDDDDGIEEEPITILRSQLDDAVSFACSENVIWKSVLD